MKGAATFSKIKTNTKRLILRPYLFGDFNICRQAHLGRLPKIDQFDEAILISALSSKELFKAKVNEFRVMGKSRDQIVFGLFLKTNGKHIGQIDFFCINRQLNWFNLGFHIHNQFQGRGYASEAALKAISIGFKDLKIHRIEAGAESRNMASIAVLKKLPMLSEGQRKNFFPGTPGIDLDVYAQNSIDF